MLILQVLDTDEGSDEKAITAMGLLNTIETVLTVMDEQPEVIRVLEPIVLQVIAHVLQNEIQEFYEEVLELIYDLTSKSISPDMWKVFELLYQVMSIVFIKLIWIKCNIFVKGLYEERSGSFHGYDARTSQLHNGGY